MRAIDAVVYTALPTAPAHHITAPAQPHATNAVVYTALLQAYSPSMDEQVIMFESWFRALTLDSGGVKNAKNHGSAMDRFYVKLSL